MRQIVKEKDFHKVLESMSVLLAHQPIIGIYLVECSEILMCDEDQRYIGLHIWGEGFVGLSEYAILHQELHSLLSLVHVGVQCRD